MRATTGLHRYIHRLLGLGAACVSVHGQEQTHGRCWQHGCCVHLCVLEGTNMDEVLDSTVLVGGFDRD